MVRASYGPVSTSDPAEMSRSARSSFFSKTPSPNSKFIFDDVKSPDPNRSTFSSSVALIPNPGTFEPRSPNYEPFTIRLWFVTLGSLFLIGVGITLEVLAQLSRQRDGFYIESTQANILGKEVTVQTLASFFAPFLIIPLYYAVLEFDSQLRTYQPYLALSRGNAPAEESIMLQYTGINRITIFLTTLQRRHKLLFISTLTVLGSYFFQPLASSVFYVKDITFPSDTTVTNERQIGLNPNIADLTAFEAAAGYSAAAVYNKLEDPPFVFRNYSTAQFSFPTTNAINGSVQVNTTAVHTTLNCAPPISMNLDKSNASNFVLTAISVEGCQLGPVQWNPNNANQRYQVAVVPNCPALPETDPEFMPVFFWFWQTAGLITPGGKNNSAAVFCVPSLELSEVFATADIGTGFLSDVVRTGSYLQPNNVTGGFLQGRAFNGLFFNSSTDDNVKARATAINSSVPHAIFQSAVDDPIGLQAVFDSPDAFTNKTLDVYTRYLSLAATSVYFTDVNQTLPAVLWELKPRLVVAPVPTHILAGIVFLTGLILLIIHVIHYSARRNVVLSMAPGPIGMTIAQTARSGFGQMLYPYDSYEQMLAKLRGLRFRLDRRTGAVVVDDTAVFDAGYGYKPGDENDGTKTYVHVAGGREDSMKRLVGGQLEPLREEEWNPHSEEPSRTSTRTIGSPPGTAHERTSLV